MRSKSRILFRLTGGTTGPSKGVDIEQEDIAADEQYSAY
jgi:hypothetical protein